MTNNRTTNHVMGVVGVAMLLATFAGQAQAQLQNASFETPDASGLGFANWTAFNNVTPELSIAQSGSASARLGGNFTGAFNVSGVFQNVPATAGQVMRARMFFQNPVGDPLGAGNFAVLNVEFFNEANNVIAVETVQAINADTPTGVWTLVTNDAIAPCDTASARIVPLFIQGPQLLGGSVLIDTASLAANGTADTFFVRNPGFEVEGYLPGWVTFGNAFREFQFTRTGTGAIKFFGNFNAPFNASGAYQVFCVEGGQSYTLSAWAGTPANDALRGGDFALLNIEVFDASGAPINAYPDPNNPGNSVNFTSVVAIAPDAPPGVYRQAINTTVMPANAAKARAVLLHLQPSATAGGGSSWFDDVSFVRDTTTPACDSIDFNADGLFPDDSDLVDFLSVLAGGPCSNDPDCSDIDFNNDNLFPDDSDLVSFLRVLAGGDC
jgi:hypothetical protein